MFISLIYLFTCNNVAILVSDANFYLSPFPFLTVVFGTEVETFNFIAVHRDSKSAESVGKSLSSLPLSIGIVELDEIQFHALLVKKIDVAI